MIIEKEHGFESDFWLAVVKNPVNKTAYGHRFSGSLNLENHPAFQKIKFAN